MKSIPFNTTKPPNLRDRVLVREVKLSRFAKEPKPAFLPRNENCTFPSAALISLSIAFICHGTRTALFLNEKKLELCFVAQQPAIYPYRADRTSLILAA